MLEETDTSGTKIRDYIFFAGRRIASRDASGNVHYYFQDERGSTRAVTDGNGNTCFSADYYPYGQEIDHDASCSPTYKFAGYEFDSAPMPSRIRGGPYRRDRTETGNYYAYARYYNPRLGRFMSPDPLGGNVANPQSLNRYTYVLNNPESLVDPLGMGPCPPGSVPIFVNGDPDGCQYVGDGGGAAGNGAPDGSGGGCTSFTASASGNCPVGNYNDGYGALIGKLPLNNNNPFAPPSLSCMHQTTSRIDGGHSSGWRRRCTRCP